ncbi:hypothetical protein HMPREF1316_0330 [Olsenella profusa F0195]|uniref:Uncharacterized protein n=1 Tax=Olsenella profusa F0195 TaxID=1125712 RepID=U2UZZ5_9ACTN|nr:hypothetical protein HMPREF1316_0330 [Olsenella profusa F0195]
MCHERSLPARRASWGQSPTYMRGYRVTGTAPPSSSARPCAAEMWHHADAGCRSVNGLGPSALCAAPGHAPLDEQG